MSDIENTVAEQEQGNTGAAAEQLADDAQEAEVSVEDVIAGLDDGDSGAETVGNEGDDSQSEQETQQEENGKEQGEGSKGRQIAAALRQQRKTIFEKELGESEETVRELIRAHRAAKLAKEHPDVSPKAARMIVEAQEKSAGRGVTDQQRAEILELFESGWKKSELNAFTQDEQANRDILDGKSVLEAAQAYRQRQEAARKPERKQETPAEPARRKATVPSARATSAGSTPEPDPIKNMTEAQYEKFIADLRRRAMSGEKVRI